MQFLLRVLSEDHSAADAALSALSAHCAAAAAAAEDEDESPAGGGGGGGGGGGMAWLAAAAVDGVGGLVPLLAEWAACCRDGDRWVPGRPCDRFDQWSDLTTVKFDGG